MKLKIRTDGTRQSARRLLDISRSLRSCRMQTEDILRGLRRHSEMEHIRRELMKQIDQMQLEAGRTGILADSLMQISQLYESQEMRNAQVLEEGRRYRKIRMSAASPENLREYFGTIIF